MTGSKKLLTVISKGRGYLPQQQQQQQQQQQLRGLDGGKTTDTEKATMCEVFVIINIIIITIIHFINH